MILNHLENEAFLLSNNIHSGGKVEIDLDDRFLLEFYDTTNLSRNINSFLVMGSQSYTLQIVSQPFAGDLNRKIGLKLPCVRYCVSNISYVKLERIRFPTFIQFDVE
jgi:hypothetical protein